MIKRLHLTLVGLLCMVWGHAQVLLTEDFSTATGTTPPTGWTNNDIASSGEVWAFDNPGSRTLNAPISDPAAIFDSDNYGTGPAEDAALESPTFDASSGTILLTFDHYFNSGFGGAYDVEVYDGSTWTSVLSGSGSSTSNPQAESIDVTAAAGGSMNAQVRFHWTGDYSWYWIVDNVTVTAVSCAPPSSLGADVLSTSSADLYWTTGGASDWNVEYGTAGFTLGSGTMVNSTNDTLNITGLTANTTYEFYVRDSCAVGDVSSWTGPFAFTTQCNTFSSLPFAEGFNSGSSTQNCWTTIDNNADGDAWDLDYGSNPYEGDESAMMYTDFNGGSNDDWLISPAITLTGNERLRYWTRVQSSSEPNDYEVLISTTGKETGDFSTNLLTDTVDVTTYAERIIDLSSYSGTVYLAFHVPSGGLDGWRLYLDDINVEAIPSCIAPSGLGVTNLTTTSADLYWTPGGASDFNVEYGATGFAPGSGTMVNTTDDTINISGLTANTGYEFYVRDSCAVGNVSAWVGPFTFTTLCNPFTAPYSENFDGAAAQDPFGGIACWSVAGPGANDIELNDSPDAGIDPAPSSPNSVELNDGEFDSGDTAILVSPPFSDLPSGANRIRFKAAFENTGEELFVGVMSNPMDPSTIVFLDTLTTNTVDIYQEYTVNMDNTAAIGSANHVIFVHGNDIYEIYLDDFNYEAIPSCQAPTALGATNVTNTSADLYWTGGGNATNWNVEYGAAGFSLGSGTALNAINDTVNVTGLSASTSYEFYVRDSCAVGDVSTWIGPFAFNTTACVPSSQCTHSLVLSDDFGDGWNGTEVSVYQNGAVVGVIGASFSSSAGSPAGDTLTSSIDLCATIPTYFVITTGSNGASNYSEEIGLEVVDPYGIQTAFYDNNATADQGDTIINFTPSCAAPACLAPSAPGAYNIATTSADLYWTEVSSASGYNIEYGPAGFTQGAGTLTNSVNDTFSLTGLTAGQCYDYYVQSDCGSDSSSWVGPYNFCTPCVPFTAPYSENFDGATAQDPFGGIACWSILGPGANDIELNDSPDSGIDPAPSLPNSVELNDGDFGSGDTAVLVTPPFSDLSTGNNRIRFKAAFESTSAELIIGVLSNPNDLATLSILDTVTSGVADVYNEYTVNFDNTGVIGSAQHIALIHGSSAFEIYVDDFNYEVIPACQAPVALGAFGVGQSSASVYWTSNNSTNDHVVEYGPAGFSLGSGTTVVASNDTTVISGLSGSTCYDYYVKDSCGPASVSAWAGPFNFCTLCAPFVAPYTESFDIDAVPNCWSAYDATGSGWEFGQLGDAGYAAGAAAEQTGNGGYYAWIDFSGSDDSTTLEMFDVDVSALTTPALQFDLFSYNTNSSDYNIMYVEAYDGTNWVQVDSLNGDLGGWALFTMDISSYVYGSNLVRIRFRGESGGGADDFHNDLLIDDVKVLELPLCLDPTNLEAPITTTNSVNLTWMSDANVTSSVIQYGTPGFSLGSGTTVATSSPGSATVSGLSAGTCYDFYVLDSCGAGTNWVGPLTVCTKSPCTVSGTPSNLVGDSTGCGGGVVTISGTPSSGQRILWKEGGQIIGTGSPFTPDTIDFTTTYEASNFNTAGSAVHVGPMPSIASSGFGNFTNGQYITVMDTLVIDSTTVRADGYVRAQVIISDKSVSDGGIISQRGAIFTTDSNTTDNYQVPVGVVLTPGTYFVSIDFLPGTVDDLFRATGGAVYPYVEPGLISIDSVNFTGPRYYYTFDLVVQQACIGTGTASTIGYVPGANAGTTDSVTVCASNSAVDLTTFLGNYDFGGTWYDDDGTGALTDSIFDATAVVTGGTYNFTYGLPPVGGCASDSATLSVTVEGAPFAGNDTTNAICKIGTTVQLRSYLPGSDLGGSWVDLDGAGSALVGSLLAADQLPSAGTYRFRYEVTATACPTDSAVITLNVEDTVNAGMSANDTICDTASAVDLTTYLGANYTTGGTWVDVDGSGGLSGSMFDPNGLTLGQTYNFRYVVNSVCGDDSATVSFYIDCTTDIPEFANGGFDVYPNPTSGKVYIESNGTDGNLIRVEVYSVSGQKLLSRELDQSAAEVSLVDMPDGIYNLILVTEEGNQVHRIIKE